jgi:hypothetical protein
MIGFVYVLSNEANPGVIKIGETSLLAEDRAKKLRTTGVPIPFKVEFRAATSHPKSVEARAHETLAPVRVSGDREFFRASVADAIDAVKKALLSAGGIDAWGSTEPHVVDRRDRIALTLEKGDFFIVYALAHLMAKRTEPIDFWQAHSTGDLLELMGSEDPGHVAGLSDGDEGHETDPVPYLDRAHEVRNGSINGRERLVPGDRLLWIRPTGTGETCKIAMFETQGYCQVTSRTWNPKFTEEGHPLLLNTPAYDKLPPAIVRVGRAACRLPIPRTWAPRTPDPADGWAPCGDNPQSEEHWLRQLAKPQRRRRQQ